MKTYLVGGAVRDILMGQAPVELDYAVAGDDAAFLAAHPDAARVGKSVRVCLWHGCEFMPLRGGSLPADLAARDLSINALALDADGHLHAHARALDDLEHSLLRPASPDAFHKDPLRLFRLARFACRHPDWQLHPDCLRLAAEIPESALAAIPAERVGRELLKALALPCPGRFLEVLEQLHLWRPWFTELEAIARIPAGPVRWHSGSVLQHTARVMNAVAGNSLAVWMALCHDLGKLLTPEEELPHHYGHEQRGLALVRLLAKRLHLPVRQEKAGLLACELHMKAGLYDRLRPGTRRDVLWTVATRGLIKEFWSVVDADSKQDISSRALADTALLHTIGLPPQWQNKGTESARKLRELHCQALVGSRST